MLSAFSRTRTSPYRKLASFFSWLKFSPTKGFPSWTLMNVPPSEYATSTANRGGYTEYRMLEKDARSSTALKMVKVNDRVVEVKASMSDVSRWSGLSTREPDWMR